MSLINWSAFQNFDTYLLLLPLLLGIASIFLAAYSAKKKVKVWVVYLIIGVILIILGLFLFADVLISYDFPFI